jgi:DNA polymerase-3 subunit gamma/tau
VLRIAKQEGYQLEKSSAELIALLGDGSYRDTLGLLQKVVTYSKDKKISIEEVESVAGAPKAASINAYVHAVAKKDLGEALTALEKGLAGSADAKVFLKLVLERMRHVALSRFAKGYLESLKEHISDDEFASVKELATNTEGSYITSAMLTRLIDAYETVDRAYIPSLPIELATVDCCA